MIRWAAYVALGLFVLYGVYMCYALVPPGEAPGWLDHSPKQLKQWSLGFLASTCFVLGCSWLIYAFEKRRQRRVIERIPTTAVRSARPGLVKISGRVKAGGEPLLQSPISKQDCIHFATEVLYLWSRAVSSGGSTWMTEYEDSKTVEFLVEDDSGAIRVGQENPDYDWPPEINVKRAWHRHEKLREFCLTRGLSRNVTSTGWGNKKRRFKEAVIRPGDKVLVLGTVKADVPGGDDVHDLYIGRGEQEGLFCISAHSERELVGKLGLRFLVALSGGTVAIASCVACLAAIFA